MNFEALEKRLRAPDGSFKLSDIDPRDTGGIGKDEAGAVLDKGLDRLRDLQTRLYAEGRHAILIILQGMDTAGKDGLISHVMSGVNPQGCEVTSFKAPSSLEQRHDFLWRCACALPERGRIGIFNRSYYEDVLVVRVHKDMLDKAPLPKTLITDDIWKERFESIHDFERHLHRNGTLVLKFFLHISRKEQKERLLARIDEPDKNWKFNAGDLAERQFWRDYVKAYEDAITHTNASHAPWYVIPADRKWFARLAVAEIIAGHLERIDPEYPVLDEAAQKDLRRARVELEKDDVSSDKTS